MRAVEKSVENVKYSLYLISMIYHYVTWRRRARGNCRMAKVIDSQAQGPMQKAQPLAGLFAYRLIKHSLLPRLPRGLPVWLPTSLRRFTAASSFSWRLTSRLIHSSLRSYSRCRPCHAPKKPLITVHAGEEAVVLGSSAVSWGADAGICRPSWFSE